MLEPHKYFEATTESRKAEQKLKTLKAQAIKMWSTITSKTHNLPTAKARNKPINIMKKLEKQEEQIDKRTEKKFQQISLSDTKAKIKLAESAINQLKKL